MTKTPHKHADLIKQWADGAAIQVFHDVCGTWRDIVGADRPLWLDSNIYRVKPEKPKYRVGEMLARGAAHSYLTTVKNDAEAEMVLSHPSFVRWLSAWVEYDA